MIDALSLTIFDDNVLSNFTGIILEISETPVFTRPPGGGAAGVGAAEEALLQRRLDDRDKLEKDKKYKKVTVRFLYNEEEYEVEKIIEDHIKVTAENVEISIVENKHVLNIKAEKL